MNTQLQTLTKSSRELKVDPKYIGVDFEWEGRDLEKGTDCVGLVWSFLKEYGITVPDSDGQEYGEGWDKGDPQRIIKVALKLGKRIDNRKDLQPLDIVIFKFRNEIVHVGVYIGYGKFLHIHAKAKSAIGRLDGVLSRYFYCGIRPTNLSYNNEDLYNEVRDVTIGDPVSLAVTFITTMVMAAAIPKITFWAAFAIATIATVATGLAAALAPKPPKVNFGEGGAAEGSVRYSFGPLQSQATSELPIGVLYGELKVSTNAIYQSAPGETVYRCDAICEGEVNSVSDVKVNDVAITELSGCSATAYTGTASQVVDSRFSNRVYGLRNLAYLALTLQTSDEMKGGFPTVTCTVQGLKVQTWDGTQWTTTKSYSNNNAACTRDFLLSKRYGIGFPESLLDQDSFGNVYDYCDTAVDDNESGTEDRYTINYIIDAKKPAVDILADMLSTFSGFLVWSGNRLRLKVEKVENVVQNFKMSNIIEGSFSYQFVSKDEAVNRVKLLYIDPAQNYTKVYVLAEDKVAQDERALIEGGEGIVEREIAVLGITKFSRASRLANLILKLSKACPRICKFRVGIYAVHCEPGDVITVSHDVPNWTKKPFRIYDITEEENDEVSLVCREYNDSVYDDSYGSGITLYSYGSPPNALKPTPDVSNITLTEVGWRQGDGTHIANIDVTWTQPGQKDFLVGYLIETSQDSGSYKQFGRVESDRTYVRVTNVDVGSSYTVKVRTVNYYGIISDGLISDSIEIIGKDDVPPDVTNFLANQYRDSLTFSWDRIISVKDISHYEIREGSSWINGTPVITGRLITNNTFNYGNIVNGTTVFWIKAVDNSGNYSESATSASVTVTSIPFQNIIATRNEHTAWSGTKVNLHTSGDNLYIDDGFLSGDYLTDWWDVGRLVTARVEFDYSVATSGDLRWDSDASTAFDTYSDLQFDGFSAPENVTFFVQTSGESGASGDLALWQYADYYFRHLRVKAVLEREDTTQSTHMTTLTLSSDVPDVDEWGPTTGLYKYCSTTGDTITYSKTFYYAPEVAIMVYPSGGIIRVPEVDSSTTGFTVVLRDKSDSAVEGNYRWHAHGF